MKTNLFMNKYRIGSSRASWHDYNGGIYFITICTAHKICEFGYIVDGQVFFTPLGQYVSFLLQEVHIHHPYAEIPLFIVMPNHVHAIIYIDHDSVVSGGTNSPAILVSAKDMRQISRTKGLLSVVVGGIKSATTAYAHKNNINFVWQTRFHDHLIHSQEECNRIAEYIENNPLNWTNDCFYQ